MFQLVTLPLVLILVTGTLFYQARTDTDTRGANQQTRLAIQNKNRIPDQSLPMKSAATDLIKEFNPSKGPKDANVIVVEFLDFECPACASAHPVLENVSEKYKNDVRFVYKMFPLRAIHPNAESAAKSALAANSQGKYFEYADMLFISQIQSKIDITDQEQIAQDLGLDIEKWKQDRESSEIASFVEIDFYDGINAQIPDESNPLLTSSIDSTPTLVFIKNGQIQYKTNGLTVDEFSEKLDELLQK
jgi:protein-disulfide isomerase